MLHTYERNGLFQNIEIAGEGGWNFPEPCLYSEDKAPGDLEVKLTATPPSVGSEASQDTCIYMCIAPIPKHKIKMKQNRTTFTYWSMFQTFLRHYNFYIR